MLRNVYLLWWEHDGLTSVHAVFPSEEEARKYISNMNPAEVFRVERQTVWRNAQELHDAEYEG